MLWWWYTDDATSTAATARCFTPLIPRSLHHFHRWTSRRVLLLACFLKIGRKWTCLDPRKMHQGRASKFSLLGTAPRRRREWEDEDRRRPAVGSFVAHLPSTSLPLHFLFPSLPSLPLLPLTLCFEKRKKNGWFCHSGKVHELTRCLTLFLRYVSFSPPAGKQRPAVSDGGDLPFGVSCQSWDTGQTECVWLKGQKSGIGEYAVPCARLCARCTFPYFGEGKTVCFPVPKDTDWEVIRSSFQLCSCFKCWQHSAGLLTLQRLKMKSCEKSAAGSYVARINLSVSAVYGKVCTLAGCELCRILVIMHFIWPQTKTFASAFKVKAEQLSLGIWATHPYLWQRSGGLEPLTDREYPALLFRHFFSTGYLRLCSVGESEYIN